MKEKESLPQKADSKPIQNTRSDAHQDSDGSTWFDAGKQQHSTAKIEMSVKEKIHARSQNRSESILWNSRLGENAINCWK
jgi:hypothetical protein